MEDPAKQRGFFELTLRDALKPGQKARLITPVYKILDDLKKLDLKDPDNEEIVNLMLQTITNPNFHKNEKAKKFVASVFYVLFFKLNEICENMKVLFRNEKDAPAGTLSDICITVWTNCDVTERSTFNIQIIKPIAECAILAETPQFSKNCRAFLEKFGASRSRKKELWSAMCHIYEPIVFRYLHAANALVRDNALSLLSQCAFPIESYEYTKEKKEELMSTQINELTTILMDESPKVRANAAKSVCKILYQYWQFFPTTSQKKLLEILSKDLSRDRKATAVRVAVLEGLDFLCDLHDGMEFVCPYIPYLAERLHDQSPQVRIAFLKLLNTVSTQSSVNIFKIIHIDHFIYRLCMDGEDVCDAIVDILKPSLFDFTVKPSKKEKSEEDLKRKLNRLRSARAIFLCHRNLQAATKFYASLAKSVLTDDILDFIHILYYWSERTAAGDPTVPMPTAQQIGSADCALPAFECEDDLERLYRVENGEEEENDEEEEKKAIPEHIAVWAIISGVMKSLGEIIKDKEQLKMIKEKIFPGFKPKEVFSRLPKFLHAKFFDILKTLGKDEDSMDLLIEYLSSDDCPSWSEALGCLTKWGTFEEYIEDQTKILDEALNGEDGEMTSEERSLKISRCVKYLMFMFSTKEILKKNNDYSQTIKTLDETILKMLYANLKIGDYSSLTEQQIQIAETMNKEFYVMTFKLIVTLHTHLLLYKLETISQNNNNNSNQNEADKEVVYIGRDLFLRMIDDIKSAFFPENIEKNTLQFDIFVALLTLLTDLISSHIFDNELLHDGIERIKEIASDGAMEGHKLKNVSLKCLSKIVEVMVVDSKNESNQAETLFRFVVDNSKDDDDAEVVDQLIETLSKAQKKKKSCSWLVGVLGDLAVQEENVSEKILETVQKCLASLNQ